MPRRVVVATLTAAVITAAAVAVYAANTILYLTPPNPLKAGLLPLVNRIEHPLFAQNWHLFAPNPIRNNFVVAVRCRTLSRITSWWDITKPMLARHGRSRSSPMGRVLRVQQNAVLALMGRTGDQDWRELACRKDRRGAFCRGRDTGARASRERGRAVLQRVALLTCREHEGAGVTAVQVRLLIHTPPPFSQRALPDAAGKTRYVTLPWMPVPGSPAVRPR